MAIKATKKWEIITHLYPRTKISQYFEKDTQIYVEKIRKKWMGDPRQLEEDLKTIRTKNFFIENQNDNLRKEVADLKKERDALKSSEDGLKTQLANSVGSATKESVVRSNTITRLGEELNKARQYEKTIKRETDNLEKQCRILQGNLKSWNTNQIRKWLKDFYPQFNKVYLPETYGLVNEGFYLWIKLLEAIADPEPTITTNFALKKVNELILSQNELNRFLSLQKVANLDGLEDKIKGLETDLVKGSKKITDTINILDGGKGTFSIPNDLIPLLTYYGKQHTLEELFNSRQSFYSMFWEDEGIADILEKGMGMRPNDIKTFDEVVKHLNNLIKNLTNTKSELVKEQNKNNQLENDKTKLTTDLTNKNKEIQTILTKWKTKDLTELSANIQNNIDKRNELAKEVENKDNIISNRDKDIEKLTELSQDLKTKLTEAQNDVSQKDKSIQTLELKNEKLTDSYKKLINYLADARLLVSHLQKDLATEKQDKTHIQKELNDALAILNKPTAEMGTQTDLTAEQITQMEKDLESFRNLLYQGAYEIDKLEKEISTAKTEQTQKEQEITELQSKVKDLTPNKIERKLIDIYATYSFNIDAKLPHVSLSFLKSYAEEWNQLRGDYEKMRQGLIEYSGCVIKRNLLEKSVEEKSKELATKNQELTNLQTKYDMEVRSKEELSEELRKEKAWLDRWVGDCYKYRKNGSVLTVLFGKKLEPTNKNTKISNHRWKLYSDNSVNGVEEYIGMEDEFGGSDIFFGEFFKQVIYKHYRSLV